MSSLWIIKRVLDYFFQFFVEVPNSFIQFHPLKNSVVSSVAIYLKLSSIGYILGLISLNLNQSNSRTNSRQNFCSQVHFSRQWLDSESKIWRLNASLVSHQEVSSMRLTIAATDHLLLLGISPFQNMIETSLWYSNSIVEYFLSSSVGICW